MHNNLDKPEFANWEPSTTGLVSESSKNGLPTTIIRTPSKLIEECQRAFDAGLLCASLTLVVTIPDVCGKLSGIPYRDWCERYLNLLNDSNKRTAARKTRKTEAELDGDFRRVTEEQRFTASDLYQLRNAVLHSASSEIEDGAYGSSYCSFHRIGICVQNNTHSLIADFECLSRGEEIYTNCSLDCLINLTALICRMAKGVHDFILEDPTREREFSLSDYSYMQGIVDFRKPSRE